MQQHQPPAEVRFAGARADIGFERRDRGGKQLNRVPWRIAEPASDGDQSTRVQMAEIGLERLDCVDRTFAERLQSGRRRRIGFEQREVYQVPASAASLDEAARLGNVQGDLRTLVEAARKL